MEYSWIAPAGHGEQYQDRTEGQRPSGAYLMSLMDLEDPAVSSVAVVLAEMSQAGIELTEETVVLATRMGRHRWETRVRSTSHHPDSVEPTAPADAIVYYIRRGAVIKIGTTRQPMKRFGALMPDEILATEPGGYALESQRHLQFKHLRIGSTEHFRMADELTTWVDQMRDRHGVPNPTWPTLVTLDRRLGRDRLRPLPAPTSPTLVTATQGAKECGIKHNTVHMWVHRRLLKPVGKNSRGRALYFLDHVAHFAACSTAAVEPPA